MSARKTTKILLFVLVLVGCCFVCVCVGGGVNKSIIRSKFSQESEVDCNGN